MHSNCMAPTAVGANVLVECNWDIPGIHPLLITCTSYNYSVPFCASNIVDKNSGARAGETAEERTVMCLANMNAKRRARADQTFMGAACPSVDLCVDAVEEQQLKQVKQLVTNN